MAVPSTTSTIMFCDHCERDVPTSNFNLHQVHCIRNLERCSVCGDMIPKNRSKEHYENTHAPVNCSQCGQSIERELLDIHERDKCIQRMVTCGYCEFPLPATELNAHLDICGNRTEYCNPCGKYVRLREKLAHDLQFHEGNSDGSGASSRDNNGANGHSSTSNGHTSPEQSRRVPRGRPRDGSNRTLFFTFAFAGLAIIIGSFVLQRRNTGQPQ